MKERIIPWKVCSERRGESFGGRFVVSEVWLSDCNGVYCDVVDCVEM